ncbi:MAG: hypothetical protein EON47_08195, partial [Acetobacteraceae bacterium]
MRVEHRPGRGGDEAAAGRRQDRPARTAIRRATAATPAWKPAYGHRNMQSGPTVPQQQGTKGMAGPEGDLDPNRDRPPLPKARFRHHLFRLVLVTTLPLAILALVLVIWNARERREDVLRGLDATNSALQMAVDRELRVTAATPEILGTSQLVDAALGPEPAAASAIAALHRQALAIIARRPAALFNISLSTAEAPRQLLNTLVPPGTPLPALGPLRYPAGRSGSQPGTREIWTEMVATRQLRISDLLWGPVAKGWLIGLSLPVLRGDRVIGVLTANILPASIGTILRELQPGSDQVIAVVDRTGIILARSRDEHVFVSAPASPQVRAFQEGTAGSGRVEAISRDGVPVYGTLRRLASVPWSVVYTAPRSEVDAPLYQTLWIAGTIALSAILAAIGGALWFGGRMGREIESLGADAQAIALTISPPPRRPADAVREVAQVRDALHRSAQALQARTAAQKAAEEHRLILMREIDHRAKNALAVVLSVVRLAPRGSSPAHFAATIEGRISAMARAHSLLAATAWRGGMLETLAKDELAPHAGQARISGPAVQLAAEAVQPLAMVLHELTANATQHGALSAPSGQVDLDWDMLAQNGLSLRWRETGGPPLLGPPPPPGFGTRLMRQIMQRQLKGEIGTEWAPAGLKVTMTVPRQMLAAVAQSPPGPDAAAPPAPQSIPAGNFTLPPRVLVVEDEALLALEMESMLLRLGYQVLGPALDLQEALALAKASPPPDAAVLDVNLGRGEWIFPVIDLLETRGVPYVLATGYG